MAEKKKKEKDYRWTTEGTLLPTTQFKIYVNLSWYKSRDGKTIEAEYRKWVTDVCYHPKTFHWDNDKPAHEFSCMASAMDFVTAVGANGYNAQIVIMPDWVTPDALMNRRLPQEDFIDKLIESWDAERKKEMKNEEQKEEISRVD